MSRPLLLLLLALAPALSGCAREAPEALDVVLPWPGAGARATYAGAGDLGVQVDAVGLRQVRDAAGTLVETVELRVLLSRGSARHATFTEFVDAAGARALVASPCETLGLGLERENPPCRGSRRVSATYAEHGLSAALGASRWWGAPLPREPMDAGHRFLGTPFAATYVPEGAPARGCLGLAASGAAFPDVGGQRYAPFAAPPARLVACHGEPFPVRVEFADGTILERASFAPGGAPLVPRGPPAASPYALPPAPGARPPEAGLPPLEGQDPMDYPVAEAHRHLLASDAGKRFLDRHPGAFLRYAALAPEAHAEALLVETARSAVRLVVVEGSDGSILHARIRKACGPAGCALETLSEGEGQRPPSTTAPGQLLSLPYARLAGLANASMESPLLSYEVGTVTWDVERPGHGTGTGFLYKFLGLPEGSFGVPPSVLVDGRTGAILTASLPRERGLDLTGLPADWGR